MYYVLYEDFDGDAPCIVGIYTTEDRVEQARTARAASITESIYAVDPAESGLTGNPQEMNEIFHECYDALKIQKIDKIDNMEVRVEW